MKLSDDPEYAKWLASMKKPHKLSKTLTYKGMTKTYKEWAEVLGISRQTIKDRVRNKWTVEQILETPQMVNRYK
jgi:hypothetical protein